MSIDGSSRKCQNLPSAPRLTKSLKYLSVSARLKLSAVTGTGALAIVEVEESGGCHVAPSELLHGLDVGQLLLLVQECLVGP